MKHINDLPDLFRFLMHRILVFWIDNMLWLLWFDMFWWLLSVSVLLRLWFFMPPP